MESSFHPDTTIQSISPLETEKILDENKGEPRQESHVSHVFGSVKMNRWAGLSAAMIMMVCNGLTYTYAVYSEFMKRKLHYSQEQTDDLGAAKDFGAFVGLISGLCYFLFPPWVSIFIGAVMHFLGYTMILSTLTGRIEASFWLLCFYSAIATGGDNWVDTACIMTSLESFKDFKGTAVGILKSQLGLSAAIFVTVYEAFLESKVINFLVLITVVPTVVYLGLAFLIRPHNASHKEITDELDTIQRFKVVSGFVVLLGIFLMGFMTLEEAFDLKDTAEKLVAAVMLILLGLMLVAPLFHKPLDRLQAIFSMQPPFALEPDFKHPNLVKDQLDGETITDEERTHLTSMKELSRLHAVPALEDSLELTELPSQNDGQALYHSSKDGLCSIDFWLLTFAVSSGAGSGLAVINNFAQICKAVKSDTVDAFVGIISIWSCFGRLVSGYGSDLMMNAGIPRPICLLISQTAMCLCCLLLSTGFTPFLFIGSAVVGMAYGSFWTLAPTVISEVFGLRQVATLYKFLGLGPTVASYLLSAKVLGYLYDKEALVYHENHDVLEENVCYGKRCFEFGLLSLASVCFVGAVACSWFAHRTKKVYLKSGHIRLPTSL